MQGKQFFVQLNWINVIMRSLKHSRYQRISCKKTLSFTMSHMFILSWCIKESIYYMKLALTFASTACVVISECTDSHPRPFAPLCPDLHLCKLPPTVAQEVVCTIQRKQVVVVVVCSEEETIGTGEEDHKLESQLWSEAPHLKECMESSFRQDDFVWWDSREFQGYDSARVRK